MHNIKGFCKEGVEIAFSATPTGSKELGYFPAVGDVSDNFVHRSVTSLYIISADAKTLLLSCIKYNSL